MNDKINGVNNAINLIDTKKNEREREIETERERT